MVEAGDRVEVRSEGSRFEGVVMPSSPDDGLVLKLDDGYNVGFERGSVEVEVLAEAEADVGETDVETGVTEVEVDGSLPTVSLLSTGGTIASTVDYRTGAVTARFTADDVLSAIPELREQANYRGRVVANELSENLGPADWRALARAVYEEIERGVDGVVVMHGTDTMAFSASALAFMLDVPVPVVFVGSQRSADRPSSDNVVNAVCAVEAAKSDAAEVMVCMHAGRGDEGCSLHRGVRARKNHTSRRDAFESVGTRPMGYVDYESRDVELKDGYRERGETDLEMESALESDVEHVKFVPGKPPSRFPDDAAGVVIEGTGLGHVHTDWIEVIDGYDGVAVMTSGCIDGRVCDRVYDTGRDLLDAGVVEAGDTLPETAYVKLMWALANHPEPREAMASDLEGELTGSSRPWT
ncbi:MAG: Glu-tRNA(Gln) amidotransferase subunit GatD [Halobacteriales archaeon]